MSLAWPSSTHRVSQVIPAGPANRLARAVCRALLACALLGAVPGANATLKVVPEKKGSAGAASPAAPPAREPASKEPSSKEPASRDSAPKEPGAKEGSGRDPAARDPGAKDPPARDPPARKSPARIQAGAIRWSRSPAAGTAAGASRLQLRAHVPSPAVPRAAMNWSHCLWARWAPRTSIACEARVACRRSLHQSRVRPRRGRHRTGPCSPVVRHAARGPEEPGCSRRVQGRCSGLRCAMFGESR